MLLLLACSTGFKVLDKLWYIGFDMPPDTDMKNLGIKNKWKLYDTLRTTYVAKGSRFHKYGATTSAISIAF